MEGDKVVLTIFSETVCGKISKLYRDGIGHEDKNFTLAVESMEKTAGLEE
jgi:hypothetical protein